MCYQIIANKCTFDRDLSHYKVDWGRLVNCAIGSLEIPELTLASRLASVSIEHLKE